MMNNKSKIKVEGEKCSAPKQTLECDKCNKTFDSSYGYKIHIAAHDGNQFKCDFGGKCGKVFNRAAALRKHNINWHFKLGNYDCELCPFSEKNVAQLKKHMQKSHPEAETFDCELCKSTYFTREKLNQHSLSHQGKAAFQCTECPEMFKTETLMRRHRTVKHDKLTLHTCTACQFRFLVCCPKEVGLARSLWKKKHPPDCFYVCLGCQGVTEVEMDEDEGYDEPEIITEDQAREAVMNTTIKVEPEIRTEEQAREVVMDIKVEAEINDAEEQPNKDTEPQQSHDTEAAGRVTYQCNICNNTYEAKRRYRNHHRKKHPNQSRDLSVHTVYSCDSCSDVFESVKQLCKHVRKVHKVTVGSAAYSCTVCGNVYGDLGKLLNHHNKRHDGENVDCREKGPNVECEEKAKKQKTEKKKKQKKQKTGIIC